MEYDDYWFNYVLKANPLDIKKVIKEDYLTSDGLKIHLDIYDKEVPLEKTIIFVHGTSVYSRFYAEFCYNLFKKGYRVIAPDLIGHGVSEGKRGHFTMEKFTKMVRDVTSYISEKYGKKIIIMGSSLGGITTLYCAAYDNRIKGAICHNAAIFNEKAYKKIIKLKGFLKILKPFVPFFAKIVPKLKISVYLYLDFNKLAKSEFIDRIDFLLNDKILSDKYTMTSIRTQMREPLARPIELIEAPTMIINGDEDYLFSVEYMQEIYDRLNCENKKLVILKGASHLIFQENIEEALERIVPWLDKIF
ncbi:MAG: alpha/beta hydrolase [Promethearchaeota archaeon]